MLLETITPQTGTTVGVAMPISVSSRTGGGKGTGRGGEAHEGERLTAGSGAWHWFGDKRADWRPKTYWPPAKVKIDADMKGVNNGNGRYGVQQLHTPSRSVTTTCARMSR
ncbi:hypothetical protein SAVCW2_00020 [Streptomyces avermitilis]|nr:Ig-like domain-containing protein [Streptomyces avermitilis]GDY80803.1 hypothetical protein SAVCW2_00020 [Streptomyces avermitilis]